jgi:NAD(P)-dependent dehydrogenase (short-subunit alcohol dehydrogenase family)
MSSWADARQRSGPEPLGSVVDVQTVDVSRPEDVDRLVTHTVEWFGHVDTKIATAGVVVDRPFLEATPPAELELRQRRHARISSPFHATRVNRGSSTCTR